VLCHEAVGGQVPAIFAIKSSSSDLGDGYLMADTIPKVFALLTLAGTPVQIEKSIFNFRTGSSQNLSECLKGWGEVIVKCYVFLTFYPLFYYLIEVSFKLKIPW